MAADKDIVLSPITGVLDLRSTPDLIPKGGVRFRQNLQTLAEGKLRRGTGWQKFLSKSDYNNSDFHDQLLGLCPPYATVTPAMYWPFTDDSLLDVIQSHALAEFSTIHNEEFVAGFIGRGIRFKPGDPTVNWGYTTGKTSLLAYTGGDIALTGWFKITALPANNYQVLADFRLYDASDVEQQSIIVLARSDGTLGLLISGPSFEQTDVAFPYADDAWHFLVIHYASSGVLRALVDNVEIGALPAVVLATNLPKAALVFRSGAGGSDDGGDWSTDERGVFLNETYDNTFFTFLWNEGLGRTWPWVYPPS